jgi:hypothetical protein
MSLASFDINKRIASLLLDIKIYNVLYSGEHTAPLIEEVERLKRIRKLDIWQALTDLP